MNRLRIALAIFVGFGCSQVALANEYAMSYSNAELASADGVKDVHERIVKVAKLYCPTYSQVRNHREVRACVDEVVNDLVNKVDHPSLTSFHNTDNSVRVASAEDVQPNNS